MLLGCLIVPLEKTTNKNKHMKYKMNSYCFQVYCKVGGGRAVVKATNKRDAEVVYLNDCYFGNYDETDPSKHVRSFRLIAINCKPILNHRKLIKVPANK